MRQLLQIAFVVSMASSASAGDCTPEGCNTDAVAAGLRIVLAATGEDAPSSLPAGTEVRAVVSAGTNTPPGPDPLIFCDLVDSVTTVIWPDGREEPIDLGAYGFGHPDGLGQVVRESETTYILDIADGCQPAFRIEHLALQCNGYIASANPQPWDFTEVCDPDLDDDGDVDVEDLIAAVLCFVPANCRETCDQQDLFCVIEWWGHEFDGGT